MARVSVITPAYRGEDTIRRAVVSVLGQTMPDVELIVVDDHSPDNTAGVLRDLEKELADNRLTVIYHENNTGVSGARNSALERASGDYIAFLDGDDYWESIYLERMLREVESAPDTDVVCCGRTIHLSNGQTRTEHSRFLGTLAGAEAVRAFLTDNLTPFLWDKLFAAATFQGLRFPEHIHRGEDQVVAAIALSRARRVTSIPDALANYVVGTQSLTWGRVPDPQEYEDAARFLAEQLGPEWMAEPENLSAFLVYRTLAMMILAQSAMRSEKDTADIVRAARSSISLPMLRATAQARPQLAAGAALLRTCPALYRKIYLRYVRSTYAIAD
ncbi:glycosyltransferase family 2 protein [Actinotignum timonense]|uniref:glycosyltransferase family 2 protein n=1 Tax=Actinotignum TaxID=1653174 RepID=UPI00254F49F8|nr:glycosyltransferase family 2 protein [Actinotignum timonense]MDK6926933.1 glycosyltransferase family 2 protein [Actinotignum timonense]